MIDKCETMCLSSNSQCKKNYQTQILTTRKKNKLNLKLNFD